MRQINCGPISWFRPENHWQNNSKLLLDIIDYCQRKPTSRSAQTLELVMNYIDVILAEPEARSDGSLAALFTAIHKTSCDSSRLSRTYVDKTVLASLDNIKDYVEKYDNTRSNIIAKSIGIIA